MKINPLSTSNSSLHTGQEQYTQFSTQKERLFKAFSGYPKTTLMVSIETGISRTSICPYVAKWKEQGNIKLVKKGSCLISEYRAGYYTTNPAIVEPSKPQSHE